MIGTIPLGEVVSITRDAVAPQSIPPDTKYVGLENITGDGAIVDIRVVGNGDLASTKFSFNPQHVLYGKLRPYLRKIARPEFGGICSTDILPLLPGPRVDRDYLAHFLRLDSSIAFAESRSVGVNLPRISPHVLATLEIPLPSRAEQRRIAAILDKADALRQKRRLALQKLDSLTQSIFLDMFGDPATNSKNLPLKSLGELGRWKSGGTPPRSNENYFRGSIPWFSSGELEQMYTGKSRELITDEALKETSAKPVPRGALLLGMYDTAALKSSIAAADCSCNQAVAFARINANIAETVYVYSAISIGRDHFRRLQRGVRQKNLNLEMISQIRIPVPDIEHQRKFNDAIRKIERRHSELNSSLCNLNALFDGVQHRAFRGEL